MGKKAGSQTESGDSELAEIDSDLEEPTPYAVFLHNDDYTTMEFVVEVLVKFFKKSHDDAMEITLKVHHEGRGLAGVYTQEIAETKVAQVTEYAKASQFPLKCTFEPA